jgi:outer membrane protein, heavy metal efflux system
MAQPVLEIFLLPLRKRVAAAAFEAAKLRVTDAALGLEAATRTAFFRVQAAEQALASARTLADEAETGAALAGRQHQAGDITDLDLATEQALAGQGKLEVVQSEIELTAAREELNRDLGLPSAATEWQVTAPLPALPAADPPLAGLEAAAVARRQDLAALHRDAEAAERALPLTRTAGIDDAQVGAHQERDAEGGRTTGPAATISVPIFNRGQAARRRAEARLRQARDRYQARVTEVQSEVREAWGRLLAARREAGLYRDSLLPLRRSIVELAQTSYNGMQVGIFQLLAAKQDAVRAERGGIAAVRDYWLARTRLERAIAGRLPAEPVAPATAAPKPPAAPRESSARRAARRRRAGRRAARSCQSCCASRSSRAKGPMIRARSAAVLAPRVLLATGPAGRGASDLGMMAPSSAELRILHQGSHSGF